MDHYYVNKIPDAANRTYLGFFAGCGDALREARKQYADVDGCRFCCPPCHKR